ncbi:uncharacterized protein LOC110046609 [Orbicella faveolata]|uniref:uncharacterized protein LOC110046609 n=1 Tax=Orbicella faveolata TaxID=48498 RepID=UPI0009E58350|nr:uncharacterized protein LOC110046609 [Orbicella faveolata]
MKECHLPIGKRVLVKSARTHAKIVCMVWPSSGVSPEGAALTPLSLVNSQVSAGDIVTVGTIASLCLHAARVELELW